MVDRLLQPKGRFTDSALNDYLDHTEALTEMYRHDSHVQVGFAPHSIRAVPGSWLEGIAAGKPRAKSSTFMPVSKDESLKRVWRSMGKNPSSSSILSDCLENEPPLSMRHI